MASAKKLLEQKSYREVSVLSVVADSGVNRNTFYYHFKDMPALVRELALGAARNIVDSSNDPAELLQLAVKAVYDNKKSVMHVYSSADREIFDRELEAVCSCFALAIAERMTPGKWMGETERENCTRLLTCSLYGLMSINLLRGLREEERGQMEMLAVECLKVFN